MRKSPRQEVPEAVCMYVCGVVMVEGWRCILELEKPIRA